MRRNVKAPSVSSKTRTAERGELDQGSAAVAGDSDTSVLATRLLELVGWLKPVPEEWLEKVTPDGQPIGEKIVPAKCTTYRDLTSTWKQAFKWRQDLDDVLSVMLSLALSTNQQGDQLFCMVIGDAGSGKTEMCDGMLVSSCCYPLEHLTGFFSGYKGNDGDGKDFSLITRVNGKLMITPEGDVLMSNPKAQEIMAQQRRIFDGVSGATYKNLDEDRRYTGLRTPWIIAGTPALLDGEQSRLGDRFLKVFIESPSESQRQEVLRRISRAAFNAVQSESVGEDLVGEHKLLARRMTGGYVDWLRSNTSLLSEISCDDKYLDACELMGDLTSYLRARPGKMEDAKPTREQPTRLTSQFTRLLACLTVVLNRTEVDDEVLRRVRKVALDTGAGIGREVLDILAEADNQYTPNRVFHLKMDYNKLSIDRQIRLMYRIGALTLSTDDPAYVQKTAKPFWRMSPRVWTLYRVVVQGLDLRECSHGY